MDRETFNNPSNEFAIQTHGLVKKYKELTAVNGIDIAIKKGEIFSLLGPNGAGKTTTINMLCCLTKPTAGTATILGYDILKHPSEIKQKINVSPQETAVASHLSCWENLVLMGGIYGLSKSEACRRAEELLKMIELTDRKKNQARKLSGGMQRRLSIAMALISDPEILFLDEPTLGLDPKARRDLWKHIEAFKGKKTILLTTHYLEEADALADRIAIIRDGDIIALGTSSELKNQFINKQTMSVRGQNITSEVIDKVKQIYPETSEIDHGLEINAEKIDFNEVVDLLRSNGVKIEWQTMKEASLDDVFLNLTEEEVVK